VYSIYIHFCNYFQSY